MIPLETCFFFPWYLTAVDVLILKFFVSLSGCLFLLLLLFLYYFIVNNDKIQDIEQYTAYKRGRQVPSALSRS